MGATDVTVVITVHATHPRAVHRTRRARTSRNAPRPRSSGWRASQATPVSITRIGSAQVLGSSYGPDASHTTANGTPRRTENKPIETRDGDPTGATRAVAIVRS